MEAGDGEPLQGLSVAVLPAGDRERKGSQNPARFVRRLRENNERVRFLSDEEEKRLREAIQSECPEHTPDLDVALNTGMRKGEQYGLNWKDVDLHARRLTLRETKNGSVRHIPLNSVAMEAFKTLAKRTGRRGRVFGPPDGSHPVLAHRGWWEAVVEKAELVDFHWHDTRHHFASKAVMAGVDLRTLQQLLGHKSLQMVCRYTHLSQSHELAAVEKLCKMPSDSTLPLKLGESQSSEAGSSINGFELAKKASQAACVTSAPSDGNGTCED